MAYSFPKHEFILFAGCPTKMKNSADDLKNFIPGTIALFGSGETTPSGRKIFESLFKIVETEKSLRPPLKGLDDLPKPMNIALLETPAGFELNSAQVVKRISDFICHHLQNYHPKTHIIPARKRGTPYSPDDPQIVAPLLEADVIFMGPGSPTYAVRQLRESLAWHYLVACHRLGSALALSSAATIAISAYALPVYEIYKVGEEIHWKEGLNLFNPFGLRLVFIPHWNNQDGGEELDTSRCYMGRTRFQALLEILPEEITVIGIDEKTGLLMDFHSHQCRVVGSGKVTIFHTGTQREIKHGQTFPFDLLGTFRMPSPSDDLPQEIWQQVLERKTQQPQDDSQIALPPNEILQLVEQREGARRRKDWQTADELRQQIAHRGWRVLDTPDGPKIEPIPK
jgi:hypothetical protein